MDGEPGVDKPGHGDSATAALGDAIPISFSSRFARRPPACVQRDRLPRGGAKDSEGIAAEVAGVWLDDDHHRGDGDRRVDGVAAVAQHIAPDERGERLTGRDRAAPADERTASRRLEIRSIR